ncbi:transcription antitermination factor NusB [Almyronema epifaneia]|uniref:Transcription antitermination protein NusB n=1 Tax=Almyronema epifaneia S1 TaxID=2991925 RepID=A0ABW6IEM6_9CYAN
MQARRIARELALLGMSQLSEQPQKTRPQKLEGLILSAIRTLTTDAQETLEAAAAELKRGSDRLMKSETRATDVTAARDMVAESIEVTQSAINRLGSALEIPEFIQLANRKEVQSYALQLLSQLMDNVDAIDARLNQAMVAWQVKRLARIDRDILRTALAEILFLGIPDRVAINEAIEIAKRYSGDDGHRFVNGVLRRVTDQIAQEKHALDSAESSSASLS